LSSIEKERKKIKMQCRRERERERKSRADEKDDIYYSKSKRVEKCILNAIAID
jgi:hypothetical protein